MILNPNDMRPSSRMCTSAQFKSASPTYKSRTRVSSPSLPASPPLPRFSCQFVHFQFSSGRVETACRARETAPQDTTKCRRHRGRPPCTAAARPLFECAAPRPASLRVRQPTASEFTFTAGATYTADAPPLCVRTIMQPRAPAGAA